VFIQAALALLCLGVEAAPVVEEPLALTVMSFNVRYGTAADGENAWPNRRELLVETIKAQDPDVVGVQECLAFQAEYIEEELRGYRWLGRGRERSGDGEMTAVFYRERALSPISMETFWLSEQPGVPGSVSWDSSLTRIATRVQFYHAKSNKMVHVFNTHFDHRGQQAREESARLLLARTKLIPEGERVIVMGDFNAIAEDSAPYATLVEGGLYDAWLSAPERKGPVVTWSAFSAPDMESKQRIDWILFRGPLDCVEVETVTYNKEGRYPSDHFPVVAKFREEL
jgi:endonuclease/exonuclease/phosphatase family metal-dependent hydrolase